VHVTAMRDSQESGTLITSRVAKASFIGDTALIKSLCLLGTLVSFSGVAGAESITTILCSNKDPLASKLPLCHTAPEVNSAAAPAGLALLAGGLAILLSRKARHRV
jgi:hypothetical protein